MADVGQTVITVERAGDGQWRVHGSTCVGERQWRDWDFPIRYAVAEAAQRVVEERWGLLRWQELDAGSRLRADVSPEQTFEAMGPK